eukprot:1158602-Pelagomonas_calceolata.AAC.6
MVTPQTNSTCWHDALMLKVLKYDTTAFHSCMCIQAHMHRAEGSSYLQAPSTEDPHALHGLHGAGWAIVASVVGP